MDDEISKANLLRTTRSIATEENHFTAEFSENHPRTSSGADGFMRVAIGHRRDVKPFTCPYERCTSAFKRNADLQRHINSKHDKTTRILCPVKGCFKKQIRRSFARFDKLNAHLRAIHDVGSLCECPSKECSGEKLLSLLEFDVHTRKFHSGWLRRGLEGYGILPSWFCPIRACGVSQTQRSLRDHIVKHFMNGDHARVEAHAEGLIRKNLLLVSCNSTHQVSGVHIRCPVCNDICRDSQEFCDHIYKMHLIEASEVQHFEVWEASITPYEGIFGRVREDNNWLIEAPMKCPACQYSLPILKDIPTQLADHHVSMYRTDLSYLKPYRAQILEHYARFGTEECWRSVWDDLADPALRPGLRHH